MLSLKRRKEKTTKNTPTYHLVTLHTVPKKNLHLRQYLLLGGNLRVRFAIPRTLNFWEWEVGAGMKGPPRLGIPFCPQEMYRWPWRGYEDHHCSEIRSRWGISSKSSMNWIRLASYFCHTLVCWMEKRLKCPAHFLKKEDDLPSWCKTASENRLDRLPQFS